MIKARTAPHTIVFLSLAFAAAVGSAAFAHTYTGIEWGALATARVQSPNANVDDYPIPIGGTDLSIVCFKVRNSTSLYDPRITGIGMDLPGELTGFTLISPTDGSFRLIEQVGNVPGLRDATLDFALVTGPTFGGGRPNAGLARSATPTTFCVSGPFDREVAIERILDHGVVRFQRVGANGDLGDVAIPPQ